MKSEWRRFAQIGLWLSLAAAIASLVLYILQRQWNLPLQILLGLVVIGLAFFALMDPGRVRELFTGRRARYGSNAIILVIAFLGILVVVNYFVFENDKQWDLTEDKENTLAAETIDVLEILPEPVVAKAFFTSATSAAQAESLLDQYVFQSGGKFSYEFIDPVSDPVAATEANVSVDGTIVLTMGDVQEPVEYVTEEEVTSALVRIMNPGENVVYFLTGHGEFDLEGDPDASFSQLKTKLEGKNYSVLPLNLLTDKLIPTDADVIVIGGPQVSLSDLEIGLLSAYLNNGGSMIVMEEPIILNQMVDGVDLLADYLAQDWGIILGKDIVVDLSSQEIFLAYSYEIRSHAITDKLRIAQTVFPTARSVTISDAISDGVSQAQLILTADQSWAETDFAGLEAGTLNQDTGVDIAGPVTLAVVAENFNTEGRIVVFGDAEFATNSYFTAYGNVDMLVNSIDWAAGQENIISLTPKAATQRVLITPKTYTVGLLFLGSIILLPGIILAGGISAWIMRRRRG